MPLSRSRTFINLNLLIYGEEKTNVVPNLVAKYSLLSKPNMNIAELSEQYSNVKKTLISDFSFDTVYNAIDKLERLVENLPSCSSNKFTELLQAKCQYLLGCCAFYVEIIDFIKGEEVMIGFIKSALKLIEQANKNIRLPNHIQAQQEIQSFMYTMIEIQGIAAASEGRTKLCKPTSPVEEPLRKVVTENCFIENYNNNLHRRVNALIKEMPAKAKTIILKAIEFEEKFSPSHQIYTPR